MLDPNKAIRTFKKDSKDIFVFNCLQCKNEIFKNKYDCKLSKGYCQKCNPGNFKPRPSNDLKEKQCRKCLRIRDINLFDKRPESGLYRTECRHCRTITQNFSITSKEYDEMLEKQNHCCALCGISKNLFTKNLAIDHCHKTGKIRGLLCSHCNTGLGQFKDNTELLQKAIGYLNGKISSYSG